MLRRLSPRMRKEYRCQAFVEAVTDYLEGTMPARQRARFEHHVTQCDGCEHYLAQMRETIRLSGLLTPGDVDALGLHARETLINAFRSFQSQR